MDIITIKKNDPLFPEAFKAIGSDCPETIYVIGNLDLSKSGDMVAIIGSRKASRRGISAAYTFGSKKPSASSPFTGSDCCRMPRT